MKSERRKTMEDTWTSEDLTKHIRAAQVDTHKNQRVREKIHHRGKDSNFADAQEHRHQDREQDGYKERDRERHKSRERHRSKEVYRDLNAEEKRHNERAGAGEKEMHKESFRGSETEKTRENDSGRENPKKWEQQTYRDQGKKRDQDQEKKVHSEMNRELKREREERIKDEERTRKHREKGQKVHENDTSNESDRGHIRFQNEVSEHTYRDKTLLDKEQGRQRTKHEKEKDMSRKPKEQKDLDNHFRESTQDQKQRGVNEENHATSYKNLEQQYRKKRGTEWQSGERDRERRHAELSIGRNTEMNFGDGNQKGREGDQQERKGREMKERPFDSDKSKRHQEKKGRDEKDLAEEFADEVSNRKHRKWKEGNLEGQPSELNQERQHRERKERRDLEGQLSDRDRESYREGKERKERDVEGHFSEKDQEKQHVRRNERDRERQHRDKKERKERVLEGQFRDGDQERRHKERKEGKRDGRDSSGTEGKYKEHKEQKGKEDLERKNSNKEDEREETVVEDTPTTEAIFEADYEEDFEEYDDDFEDDDGCEGEDKTEEEKESTSTHRNPVIEEIRRAIIAENERIGRFPIVSNPEATVEQTKTAKETVPKGSSRGTFIDFVTAKRQQISHQLASRQKKRFAELCRLIDLDFSVTFSLMDLPPVSEYDMYIKHFGRTNTKQAYVQYNDDNLDRDIQTEEVETLEKWTQFPAAGAVVCGGPSADSDLSVDFSSTPRIDTQKLIHFLRSACQVMSVLIEEDRAELQPNQIFKSKGTSLSVCDGCFQFNTNLPFLCDRVVHCLSLSPVQRQTVLSVHGLLRKPSAVRLDSKFILCVWNIWEPSSSQKVLVCDSVVRCCCFGPGKATLVFAGTADGSVVLWDLREHSSLHNTMKIGDSEWVFREPTFCTDGILTTVNHSCPVHAVETISVRAADGKNHSLSFSAPHEETSGLSFQLASLDESGLLNLWVIVELPKADIAGSQFDLGLIPGGKVKLLHSSRISMNNSILHMGAHLGVLQTSSIKFLPSDPNHFIMGTDVGVVIRGTRHGLRASPRLYKPQQNGPRPVQVTCLNFCPYEEMLFLVGCSDGSLRLHRTISEYPVFQWNDSTEGQPVVSVQWSLTRPAVFFVLDAASYIYIWDLLDNDMQPVTKEFIQPDVVTAITVLGDPEKPNALSGLILARQSGTVEIQYLNKRWTAIQQEELQKLRHILQFAI